jgi:glucosamine 6-phosphate synthetase-like amidotransferase/phosphosugar isomerase protein
VKLALYVYETDPKVRHDLLRLTLKIVHHLEGAYALILKSSHFPGEACAVRRSSPLVLGIKAQSLEEDVIRMINTTRNLKLSTDTLNSPMSEGAFKLQPHASAEFFLVCRIPSLFFMS